MPNAIRTYVRVIDRLSDWVGIVAMYLIFAMVGILLLDAVTRNVIEVPLHWCIELAQFTLAAYYFMGGAITLKNDEHVRMDLFYEKLSVRGKAKMDLATVGCLLFYLVVLLIGSISSLTYAIETNETRFSMWNPSMIPIKSLMVACLVLMLLQGISIVFKQIAILRGEPFGEPPPGGGSDEPAGGAGSGALDDSAPERADAGARRGPDVVADNSASPETNRYSRSNERGARS